MKELSKETISKLVGMAAEAREHSYSPYSQYAVGAALLTESGRIYQGCNIENAGYTATVCAERTAFFKAVFDGERDFAAIAVVADGFRLGYPCGVCRQVMAEFCEPDFQIITADKKQKQISIVSFEALLPHPFGPKDLGK